LIIIIKFSFILAYDSLGWLIASKVSECIVSLGSWP
jgi:hypothetical protein